MAGPRKLKTFDILTIEQLSDAFVAAIQALVRAKFQERASAARQDKLIDDIEAISKEIKSRGEDGTNLFRALLSHADPQVRLDSATELFDLDKGPALATVREIAGIGGVVAFSAQRALVWMEK